MSIGRPLRGAVLAVAALADAGCQDIVTEVSVGFLFAEDTTPLGSTDNVSVTLTPDGFSETFAAEGPDFAVEIELEPDREPRSLAVYMARGETLLGYGITPPFTYDGAAGVDLRVFISYPGTLTTYPFAFDVPDASTLAARAAGRGLVALGGDGSTLFVDAYTHLRIAAEPLSPARGLPDPSDGLLVSNPAGNVDRILWRDGLSGYRFEVLTNAWSELALDGATAVGVRADAISLQDADLGHLYLFGGGIALDTVSVDLRADGQTVSIHPLWTLDVARPGATASWLQVEGRDDEPIVMGSAGDDTPALWWPARGRAVGPMGRWTQARCVQIDAPTADPIRLVCAGGLRADAPTADALVIGVPAVGEVTVQELPAWLPAPIEDPRWMSDDGAVYAQGSGRLVRVDRGALTVTEPAAAALRWQGGHAVSFDTTVTFLVGGVDQAGLPLTQWQVFTPELR